MNDRRAELLQSIATVARLIFAARAASIALLDPEQGDFVFQAVSGEGDESLVGVRFPAGRGLAGLVAQSGEALIVDDLSSDPRFARDVAADTGYVPNAMMVAPLLGEDRVLGVLSVLDRGETPQSALQQLELLGHFATQAALSVVIADAGDAGGAPRMSAALDRLLAAADELRSLR